MQSFRSLVSLFEQRLLQADLFPQQPANLYDPCKYLLRLGGKRIRPVVCLMANELFSDIRDDAWHAAIAIELFHNFTLIHDDIMDKAPLRRGHPTIHARYGLTAGILGGDAMSIYAYQSLARVNTQFKAVLDVFNRTAIEVCEGQQMDMDFETRDDVSAEEYIHMISLKTSVLLAASMQIGALIAEAAPEDCTAIYDFGKNLGIAFQLQDDYLDAFGESSKLGKQKGGDIMANKKTYLHIHAVNNADGEQHSAIQQWLQSDNTIDKVPAMLKLFKDTAADNRCREAVAAYSRRAFESLQRVSAPVEKKIYLQQLAEDLLNREQ